VPPSSGFDNGPTGPWRSAGPSRTFGPTGATIGCISLDTDTLGELLDELGIELDLNSVGLALEPVVGELMAGPPYAGLDRAAGSAAEDIWDDELRAELEASLAELRDVPEIEEILRELRRPPRENLVVRTLVFRATAAVMAMANRNYDRMAELEAELRETQLAEHRPKTLPVAAAAIPSASIGADEADAAAVEFIASFPPDWSEAPEVATAATHQLARALATDERRASMRRALTMLAESAEDDFPLASQALSRLLAEAVPSDPADDDLWVNLTVGLLQEQLADVADELESEI
jgi:hypothetical protein